MLAHHPLFWKLPAESREMVRAVYRQKVPCMTLAAFREEVDPLECSTSKARGIAVEFAVQQGFLVVGRRGGEVVVAAPWIRLEEVIKGHPSVRGFAGVSRPISPVVEGKAVRKAAERSATVPTEVVDKVWSAFLRITGKRYKMNDRRRKACREMAGQYPIDKIEKAFEGLMRSEWHCGDNDAGVEYLEPHIVARNFERFVQMGGADEG